MWGVKSPDPGPSPATRQRAPLQKDGDPYCGIMALAGPKGNRPSASPSGRATLGAFGDKDAVCTAWDTERGPRAHGAGEADQGSKGSPEGPGVLVPAAVPPHHISSQQPQLVGPPRKEVVFCALSRLGLLLLLTQEQKAGSTWGDWNKLPSSWPWASRGQARGCCRWQRGGWHVCVTNSALPHLHSSPVRSACSGLPYSRWGN